MPNKAQRASASGKNKKHFVAKKKRKKKRTLKGKVKSQKEEFQETINKSKMDLSRLIIINSNLSKKRVITREKETFHKVNRYS